MSENCNNVSMLHVLVVEPGNQPKLRTIPHTLQACLLTAACGTRLEHSTTWSAAPSFSAPLRRMRIPSVV